LLNGDQINHVLNNWAHLHINTRNFYELYSLPINVLLLSWSIDQKNSQEEDFSFYMLLRGLRLESFYKQAFSFLLGVAKHHYNTENRTVDSASLIRPIRQSHNNCFL